MPLEPVTYINDFVETNPVGATDQRFEGDDHIRNLKKGIKNTFPGLAGRAWRTINRSANGSLASTDNMTIQNCASITLSAAAPASLGNGFMCFVRAPTTGSVTFTPGSANVNGAATFVVPAGHMAIVSSNGTEFFAVIMYATTPAQTPAFEAGTIMLFQQTTAPAGWTKVTNSTHNNAALRIVTGTASTGGLDDFTTVFGLGKSTDGHALTIAQMPSHTHSVPSGGAVVSSIDYSTNGTAFSGAQTTGPTGGGAAHSHGISNMNLKYVDLIAAVKN